MAHAEAQAQLVECIEFEPAAVCAGSGHEHRAGNPAAAEGEDNGMAPRKRTFHIIVALTLLGALLLSVLPSPGFAVAQDNGGSSIDPGSGRPDEYPARIKVGDQRFTFDRLVSVKREGLQEVDQRQNGDLRILAATAQGPFDRIFVSAGAPGGGLGRYLPEIPVAAAGPASADTQCPNENGAYAVLDTGQAQYTFANIETDLTTDRLNPAFTTDDGRQIYADAGAGDPPAELFVDGDNGLLRFVQLSSNGLPMTIADPLVFNQQRFDAAGDVTGQVDPATLTRVGCIGPYSLQAPSEQTTGPFDQLYLLLNDQTPRLVSLIAGGDAADAPAEADTGAAATGTAGAEGVDTPVSTETPDVTETPATSAETAVPDAETPAATETATITDVTATAPAEETVTAAETPGAGSSTAEAASGGQGDYPPEIAVGEQRFLIDRLVPIDPAALTEVGQVDNLAVYAKSDSGPFDYVYGASSAGAGQIARYTVETPLPDGGGATNPCPAERLNYGTLNLADSTYAFAGTEPDLTTDQLVEVATSGDGQPIYADSNDQPFTELFFSSNDGLLRFMLLDDAGQPTLFTGSLTFNDQSFTFSGDVADQVDPGTLSKLGCAGPFPLQAPTDQQTAPFSQVYVLLNAQTPRLLSYTAEGGQPVPAETATVPAETATAPAETPTVAAEVPTEVPIPTETVVPTEVPVPTETVAPTEAPVPTEAAAATEVPVTTETAVPTDAPAVASTAVAVATTEPAPQAGETPNPDVREPTATPLPVVESTQVASAVSISATPPPPPAQLPREVEVEGLRYLYDLRVDVDITTLVQVDVVQTQSQSVIIYADRDVTGPARRLYAAVDGGRTVVRYISEAPISDQGQIAIDAPCAPGADAQTFSYSFKSEQYQYVFASVETSVSVERLRQSTTAVLGEVQKTDDGREILVESGASPFDQVFLTDGNQLRRYIVLNQAGLPLTLSNLVFAETQFSFSSRVQVDVSQVGFQRIGCAGAFPLYAPPAAARADTSLSVCYTVINNQVFEFRSTRIVEAARGQTVSRSGAVAPSAGVVQITLRARQLAPTATPLPNVRVVPAAPRSGATATPQTGIFGQAPQPLPQCQGNPGATGANGLPERLPRRIQLSGIAYSFAKQETIGSDVKLTRIGCVGPFEASSAEGQDQARVLFLRFGPTSTTLYRFESATSFSVQFTVSGDARAITANGENYVLDSTWKRSIYSSVTVIVYSQDPAAPSPDQIFAVKVDGDVIAEYVPEGGDVVEPADELVAAAEEVGINPDLILGAGKRYLLVGLWRPIGTTTDGWVTLYSSAGEGTPDILCATDPRSLDLFIYRRSGTGG